jgi:hypothetical protein
LYSIVNEHGKAICEVWDGENLMFTFRWTVDQVVMNQWHELLEIASSLNLRNEEDVIIWQYSSSGVYSVQSLYTCDRTTSKMRGFVSQDHIGGFSTKRECANTHK